MNINALPWPIQNGHDLNELIADALAFTELKMNEVQLMKHLKMPYQRDKLQIWRSKFQWCKYIQSLLT